MATHEYTVEFRIWGDALDPARVSRDLGLEPCQTRTPGSSRMAGRVDRGMWAYNGRPGAPTRWESLEEGLSLVLESLWSSRERIARYAATSELVWWCGHFHSSFDGGPTLSAELLRKLGDFGAELYIDNYYSPSE
jgi:Domain of unknown function (DUF4279)